MRAITHACRERGFGPIRLAAALATLIALGAPSAFAEENPSETASPDARYRKVSHLISRQGFERMTPLRQDMLVRMAEAAERGAPASDKIFCFGPDAVPEEAWAFYAAQALRAEAGGDRWQHIGRWTATATNGSVGSTQGNPITLTYSFVPDGTTIPADDDLPGGPSNLFARLNASYGSPEGWQKHFHESFQRWGELTGVTYVYEPNDDGTPLSGLPGSLGVRGDLRVGMVNLDGNSGVLAYNNFPQNGDMVMDSADVTGANFGDPVFLQNVIMHEHGHGMGLLHVCPIDSARPKLMEPFVSVAYHGVRHDDVQSGQRHYGDRLEPNDSLAQATSMGERLFYFDFEADAAGSGVPAGFEQVAGDDLDGAAVFNDEGANWNVNDEEGASSGGVDFDGNGSGQFAYLNDRQESPLNAGEDLAIRMADSFDTSAAGSLVLNFDHRLDDTGNRGLGEVFARNETIGWTLVYDILGDTAGWQRANIDLTAFRAPDGSLLDFRGTQTRLAFRFDDENGAAGGFAIDNLELSAEGPGLRVANLSIDDNSDQDWFELPFDEQAAVLARVRPVGFAYPEGPQDFFACASDGTRNSQNIHNLSVEIRDAAGVLVSANANGLGQPEETPLAGLQAGGGPYYVRVGGGNANDIQLYELEVETRPWSGVTADLSIAVDDGAESVEPGGSLVYIVEMANAGPDDAAGARLSFPLPAQVESATWSIEYFDGASGAASSGAGDVDVLLDAMPSGSRAVATIDALIDESASAANINAMALAIGPDNSIDPSEENNEGFDIDTMVTGRPEPSHVESFGSFLGVSGAGTSSPNDTMTGFALAGGAAASTARGFARDTLVAYDGAALSFDGNETTALVNAQEFSAASYSLRSHQIAFWFQFSDNSGDTGNALTQMISVVNQGGSGPAYVLQVGRASTGTIGMRPRLPRNATFISPAPAALTPDEWHSCVVQYTSASAADPAVRDAGIAIWIDPEDAAATPRFSFPTTSNSFTSEFGDGPFGSYAFGAFAETLETGPIVYIDHLGTWNGFGVEGVNSLQEALDFLNSNAPPPRSVSTGLYAY